jgi:hypothetical protein
MEHSLSFKKLAVTQTVKKFSAFHGNNSCPEDGDIIFLRREVTNVPDYTV